MFENEGGEMELDTGLLVQERRLATLAFSADLLVMLATQEPTPKDSSVFCIQSDVPKEWAVVGLENDPPYPNPCPYPYTVHIVIASPEFAPVPEGEPIPVLNAALFERRVTA